MTRDDTIEVIRLLAPILAAVGVEHLYLFGSVARDEAGELSDIDLAFDVALNAKFDAFDMGGVVMDLMDGLGRKVDLVERQSMSPEFAARIEPDMIRIF